MEGNDQSMVPSGEQDRIVRGRVHDVDAGGSKGGNPGDVAKRAGIIGPDSIIVEMPLEVAANHDCSTAGRNRTEDACPSLHSALLGDVPFGLGRHKK